ncbi:MAG: D-aminoacyl-tRNA deacylase [Candidatus Brocadiia bacterium]
MLAVIQRVSHASVAVDGQIVGEIGVGLLALVCAVKGDDEAQAGILADRVCGLRIFNDDAGKMNRSLKDVRGSLLAVSQFTLSADVRHGRRPSFDAATPPAEGERLFDRFCSACLSLGHPVERGVFGAKMDVSLVNDGPVTIIVDSRIFPSPRQPGGTI